MQPTFAAPGRVAVIGGGPAGMTAALLLVRAGHRVVLFEKGRELGGLWAADLDGDGCQRAPSPGARDRHVSKCDDRSSSR